MQTLSASKWILVMVAVLAIFAAVVLPGRHNVSAAERDFTVQPVESSYEIETIDYTKPSPFSVPKQTTRRPSQPAQ